MPERQLERQIVIPTSPERLWDALTDEEAVSGWFGSRVEWDLRPGGRARFVDDDGTIRGGVIDVVQPTHLLRFRWWPDENEGEPDTSEVSYDLEPAEGGTRLTVTERVVTRPELDEGGGAGTTACAGDMAPIPEGRAPDGGGWGAWDGRLFRCWAGAASRNLTGAGRR